MNKYSKEREALREIDHKFSHNGQSEFVYALIRDDCGVFYVGRTTSPRQRLRQHRGKFGSSIRMLLLQDEFTDEAPSQAEAKWTNKYLADGCSLKNVALTSSRANKYGAINAREVDLLVWSTFTQRAHSLGVTVPGALGEAILDWVEKTYGSDYSTTGVARDVQDKRNRALRINPVAQINPRPV